MKIPSIDFLEVFLTGVYCIRGKKSQLIFEVDKIIF